ncbi:hypothetical protein Pla111_01250 [Botrimarina hoheduenensis]|uniref:Uncharacterized protein n=1 Tax=Botrimarina hoheduenensis TaxID=2528000 RepID=A0A5C5WF24_9BACT|nr:hypothetical protein Pla111_01250 [Botrimarina hoheduenensis]
MATGANGGLAVLRNVNVFQAPLKVAPDGEIAAACCRRQAAARRACGRVRGGFAPGAGVPAASPTKKPRVPPRWGAKRRGFSLINQ